MWDICGLTLAPGEKRQTVLRVDMGGLVHDGRLGAEKPAGGYEMPATLLCGAKPGKTLLVTAGIHSGEYAGIPAVQRAAREIEPEKLCGNLLLIHCVNTSGFWAVSPAVLPEDGFNLNKNYPGRPDGTVGERLADWFVRELFPKTDFILDFHGGSWAERMTPCIFYPDAPAVTEASLAAAKALTVPYLLRSGARGGEYSYAANFCGVPGLLLERGWGYYCQADWCDADYSDIRLLLGHLGMYEAPVGLDAADVRKTVYHAPVYITAGESGLWHPLVHEDCAVKQGELMGYMEDFFGSRIAEYRAQAPGRVIYYAAGLAVSAGDALITICLDEDAEAASQQM